MASFGSFETEREVYSGPSYTVFSARTAEYAIKVFWLVSPGSDAESATGGTRPGADAERSSIERIAVQQRAAAASKFISPVFETGHDERGVWYVTRFYPRSVDKIISGRVELNRDAVEHILRATAQGALDIKRTCGRSHGDIQPSNIHLSLSDKLAEAEVVLSDPLPGNQDEAERYELADLRAIGRILLQLVLQRRIDDDEDLIFPVLASPEWTRLFGRSADRWLSLCNRLLHPNLSLRQLKLEQLVEQLEQLRSKGSRRRILAAAGLVILLAVPAIFVLRHFNRVNPSEGETKVTVNRERQPETLVATNANVAPAAVSAGTIEFESQPAKAKISEDGTYLGETPLRKTLAPGSHKITAQFDDWPAVTEEVLVRAGENAIKQFYLPHGTAHFKIEPEGSKVIVNGSRVDGARKPMQPGAHRVRVEQPGYEPHETTITITQREVTTLTVSLKPMLGIVEFSSDPSGAAIFEAKAPQDEIGRTQPGQPLRRTFPPGSYAFIARYDGLDPVMSKPVDVSVGATISVPLKFNYATVQFNSEPTGADLLIGEQKMKTPYLHRQKPGRLAYRLELEDYEPVEGTNELAAGAAVPVLVRFRPKQVNLVLRSDPLNAEFFVADTQLRSTNGVYKLPWGSHTITARYRGLDAKTNVVDVDKSGSSSTTFVFDYATVEITNAKTRLLLNDQVVAEGPGQIYLKPDVRYDFVVESVDARTNLPVKLATRELYRPVLATPQLRRTFTNSLGMILVRIGGMTKYPNGFWVGKYEVTEGEYLKVMGKNLRPEPLPMARGIWRRGLIRTNTFRVDANHPQVMVSPQQAAEFCSKLTEMDKANGKLPPGTEYYSLPTEEQWEHFVGDAHLDDAITSRGHNPPRSKPEAVGGTRRSNRYGLCDVRGNVWEICLAQDGSPWLRGGAFDSTTETGVFGTLALNFRNQAPASPSPVVGFRVVCVPDISAPTAQK